MHFDAEAWVAIAFILFVVLLGYLGVHKRITSALDDRANKIAGELAEAKRLRDEAAAILASYKSKAAEAEKEAQSIVAQARKDAGIMAKDAETRMNEFVVRRTKQAEAKIAMAESQTAADVRAAAADAAVKAATIVMRKDPQGTGAAALLDRELVALKAHAY